MSKKDNMAMVKKAIKEMNYTIITPSIFYSKKTKDHEWESVLFNAFDNLTGTCSSIFVNFTGRYAQKEDLLNLEDTESRDITGWFFE